MSEPCGDDNALKCRGLRIGLGEGEGIREGIVTDKVCMQKVSALDWAARGIQNGGG